MHRHTPGGSASRRPLPALLALLAALILLAAACGSSDEDSVAEQASEDTVESADFETSDESFEDEAAMEEEGDFEVAEDAPTTAGESAPQVAPSNDTDGDADGDADPLGAGGTTVAQTAADLGRQLIFTAFLEVEVDDVAAASAEATEIVESRGGFLFGQNTSGGTEARSELTFKVLPADFNATLEALGDVGELRNQTVTTDDVTERVVDLESRIAVAELGVERLRTTLETTTSLEDFAEIERLLLARESELEVMRGSLRTLRDQIDLATITLVVTQDRLANNITLDISTYENHDGGQSCPGDGGRSYENGSEVTVCFDIINQGDQTLTDITLVDTVLEIDESTELITLFGSLDELAPGQAVLVAYEVEPERDLTLRTRVTAFPTDEAGEASGPSVSTRGEFNINTFEPDRDPGFGDGLGAAVDILQGLWVAIKVLAGFLLLPLLILVPLAIAFRRFVSPQLRRRREAKAERQAAASAAWQQKMASPPPPAPAATVGAATAATAAPAPRSGSGPAGAPEAPGSEGTIPPPPGGDDG